jgi:hypothetical protein
MSDKKELPEQAEGKEKRQVKLVWDDSKMENHYANVCNVSSTKEEFNLLFGTNQSWAMGQPNVRIALSNRIILNPHAAKRLAVLLSNAVNQYEEKVGPIELDGKNPSIEDAKTH